MVDGVLVSVSFEMHAYEAILTTTKTLLSQEVNVLNKDVSTVLWYLRRGVMLPKPLQEKLRDVKNKSAHLTARLEACQRALNGILCSDEEMALMNLSKLRDKPELYK